MPAPPASVKTRRRLAEPQPRHDRLVHVHVGPRVIEIGDDDDRRARRDHLADVRQLLGDDAADRRDDGGVGDGLLAGGDLRVGGGDARARGVDLLAARARRAAARGSPRRRARGRARPARAPSPRPAASPHRRAACASRSWTASSALEALDVGLRGRAARPRRRRRRRRRARDLRLGLPDVLGARAGQQQPQLRVGLLRVRPGRGRARSSASAVSSRASTSPALHAVALVDAQLERGGRRPARATCTSVASTWPDTRTRSAGGFCSHGGRDERRTAARNIRGAFGVRTECVMVSASSGSAARARAMRRCASCMWCDERRRGVDGAGPRRWRSAELLRGSARRRRKKTIGATMLKYAKSGLHGTERAGRDALLRRCAPTARGTRGERGERVAVEMRAAFGDLAQHDRRARRRARR